MTMDEAPRAEEGRAAPSENPLFIAQVVGAAGDRDGPLLRRLLADLDPADIADVLEHLPGESLRHTLQLIGADIPAEALANLNWEAREEVLSHLPAHIVAKALGELDTDDAAAVAADIDEEKLDEVLAAAEPDVRLAVEEALSFDEETAGRLMQREYVAAPDGANVGQVIDRMRVDVAELPDVFFEIYVVDPRMHPIGAVPVSKLLRMPRDTALSEIMTPPKLLVRPEMDQEEVAVAFQKYHLASAPVVDADGKLTGMVTVDDIVDVIQEESGEDLLNLAGVTDASQMDTVARSIRARAPWLTVNLLTALVSSAVIWTFQRSIAELVSLAVLMPIVASMGGNAGTQALAVTVRALAARDLTGANAARYILREAMTAAANGALFALLLGVVSGVVFQNPELGAVVGAAVFINFSCAGLAGILIPLALRRAGADPAVSSSVFVTFITDCIGFLAFLGLATFVLLR
ncbi:MAG: magnesium transporter [Hydrogenophilaceae bacterium]|jgi:magnesium transporter|nr:magnesium transporter [Hydrogenophilaceae bacterium]